MYSTQVINNMQGNLNVVAAAYLTHCVVVKLHITANTPIKYGHFLNIRGLERNEENFPWFINYPSSIAFSPHGKSR